MTARKLPDLCQHEGESHRKHEWPDGVHRHRGLRCVRCRTTMREAEARAITRRENERAAGTLQQHA